MEKKNCVICEEEITVKKESFEGREEVFVYGGVYFEEDEVYFCDVCWNKMMEPLTDKYKEFLNE